MTFSTPEAAFAACEAAGLEPLQGSDHQFGRKYGVFLPGFDHYINIYTDASFLRFCDHYFRVVELRNAAGWELKGRLGWFSPEGDTEAEWAEEGRPFPEDPDYAGWASAYWHYEALDNDLDPEAAILPTPSHLFMNPSG